MCLTVDKEKFKIDIAQEDIVVYKVLIKEDKSVISPYKDFVYEIGKEYKTRMKTRFCRDYCEINEGFHSFLTLEDSLPERKFFSQGNISACCYKCIIPKGTKVVYGEFGIYNAIVSEAIKIVEEL